MDLSRSLKSCMGVGFGIVSAEGTAYATGGGTQWLEDDTIIYQRQDGINEPPVIETRSLVTGLTGFVFERGANHLVARGGVWATWSSVDGYRDSHGRHELKWYPLAVDDYGAIAACTDYQSGTGLSIVYASTRMPIELGPLSMLEACFTEGQLLYRSGSGLKWFGLLGVSGSAVSPSLPHVSGVQHDGYGLALGWHDAHGLVVYQLGTARGLLLSADGRDFNARIRKDLASERRIVVSSSGAGERPHELRRYVVDLGAATVNGEPRAVVDLSLAPGMPTTPPTPAEAVAVTITSYVPDEGVAPLRVRAVAAFTVGESEILRWRYRREGAKDWTTAVENPSWDLDHTFTFESGAWEIGVDAVSTGTVLDGTALARRVRVTAATAEPATPQAPPLPPGAPNAPPSLSIIGKDWFNGQALYVPRWVSGLTLLVKSDADRDRFLDWAVSTGFNGVRVFAGALTWAVQTPESARSALPGLIDATKVRGLALEVTAVTDSGTGYDWRAHLRAVAALTEPHGHAVLEGGNELGHPSQASDLTPANIAAVLSGYIGPCAVGAPLSPDEPAPDGSWPAGQGTYSTVHLDRGRDPWNMARRVREIYAVVEATGKPALNNEPIGAGEHQEPGKRLNDPAIFATLGALDAAFRGVGGVHHSQTGLMATIPGPREQACADAYLASHKAVRSVLGGDVGQYFNVGHAGSPVALADFTKVTRIYFFLVGNRGVGVYVGATDGPVGEQWANGWRSVRDGYASRGADGRSLRVVEIGR